MNILFILIYGPRAIISCIFCIPYIEPFYIELFLKIIPTVTIRVATTGLRASPKSEVKAKYLMMAQVYERCERYERITKMYEIYMDDGR